MLQVEARAAARQALGLQLLAAGELWYTLRPLLYVLSLRRCACARAHCVCGWQRPLPCCVTRSV